MPPGSPGTYRKKSASLELPAALQQLPRPHRGSICGESKMADDKPWPNTKEDYELREVIGDAASVKKCVCETWKQKLVGIGIDGASVMTGCRNGLIAQLKRDLEKPELEGIHCTAHKIELAYKDAVKDVPLAKKSSLDRSMLKRAHDKCQVPFLVPTRVGGTRWLPHMLQALEHLLKSYKAIVLHMQQIQSPDDLAYHKDSSRKAKNYLLLLTSADIVQYLHLLLDVLSGRSNTFKTARRDMLTSLISSLSKRFIDMASTILQNAWILNFKLWPAEYGGNEDFGDSAVQALAQALEKTLMEAEVNPTLVEDEWTVLKSYIYKSKTSLLVRLMLNVVLASDHLTDLMVVQLQTESVGNFNSDKAIARFITTGARHVDGYTHTAGCSTVEDLDDNNELNEEHVQEMLVQMQ
ncbi:Zinc finger protein 862-like 5, partial [Homarus americanus]